MKTGLDSAKERCANIILEWKNANKTSKISRGERERETEKERC
jgi:hypothetical protein